MHELLSTLSELLGSEAVLSGEALEGRSAGIWSNEPLQALAIVRPKSTEEVSTVLRVCHAAKQSVVPVGGMTGLADAHKTDKNDIALSLERMTAIESVDVRSRKMVVQAGAILQKIQDQAQQADLMFPLDLGARASCTIGGNIATNAGGVRVIRYGMTRALVLGLEAVLADGTVVSSMSGLMKNNTGYDLSQMFVGAEGTLGVVTRAVLRLYEAPKAVETALLAVPSWDAVMTLLRRFDSRLSGGLVAFEVMWRDYYDLNTGPFSELESPLTESAPFYVLIDVFVNDTESGREAIENLLMENIECGDIVDAVIAQSETQRLKLWQIREDFEPEQKRFKQSVDFDISLDIENMDTYVEGIRQQLKAALPASELFTLGHIGDGNIHLLVGGIEVTEFDQVNQIIYSPLRGLKGSVSAEHGIGLKKKAYLGISRSPAEIALMRQVKAMMDPHGIMNPGKVFDT